MKKRTKRRAFLVPGVILLGLIIMIGLIVSRKPPQQVERPATGALVEVVKAKKTDREVMVTAYGEVQSLYTVNVMPQVGGKVVWTSPKLVAGGEFDEGELMLRIEPDDYELGVEQARARVAQAEYQYELAQANARIAREEWEMVSQNRARRNNPALPEVDMPGSGSRQTSSARSANRSSAEEPDPLVLHEPQLRQAESNLKSAKAALQQAELALGRTELRAPFNARVRSKNVAPGQIVGPSSVLANIYSTDIAEIEVSLPLADVAFLEIPGAPADVILHTGNGQFIYEGYVDRQVGVIEQTGRLAQVIVRVDDPFSNDRPDSPPLVLGAFVEVVIRGKTANNVVIVPRSALRQNDQVWVAREDSTLDIRTVDIYYRNRDNVLVSRGLEDGDQIVLTPLTGAAEGMKLRPSVTEATTETSDDARREDLRYIQQGIHEDSADPPHPVDGETESGDNTTPNGGDSGS